MNGARRLADGESSYSFHAACGCSFYEDRRGAVERRCEAHGMPGVPAPAPQLQLGGVKP